VEVKAEVAQGIVRENPLEQAAIRRENLKRIGTGTGTETGTGTGIATRIGTEIGTGKGARRTVVDRGRKMKKVPEGRHVDLMYLHHQAGKRTEGKILLSPVLKVGCVLMNSTDSREFWVQELSVL